MSRIGQIRWLVESGLYYLTERALEEAEADGFDVWDVEHALLTGKIARTWRREGTCEVVGEALDRRSVGVVCRITKGLKVRVITVYDYSR